MSDEIGELLEVPGEVRGMWRIPGILSLLEGETEEYFSPKFLFWGACWSLNIDFVKNEWIRLYLFIMNCDSPKEVRYSFGIRDASGKEETSVRECATFSQEDAHCWGEDQFLKVSDLQRRKTELAPSGFLTISFTLKSEAQRPSEDSLFRRLWNMSLSFKNILSTKKRSDVTLKLKDGTLPAHRMILESRCPVFNRMFDVDLRESQTGEVNIEDATASAFQVVLFYAYSGDPEGLSCENVCEVYKIAHKYEFVDLTKLCAKFMRETLCVSTFCDVMTVAHLYQETALKVCLREFFAKNKSAVFKSEKWKTFKKDEPSIDFGILEWLLGEEIQELRASTPSTVPFIEFKM